MQVFLYFSQKLVEDSVGMINVMFLHNSNLFIGAEDTHSVFERARKLVECLPSRFHAIHLCLPNKPFCNVVKSAIMLLMGRENRYRVRIHVGTHLECHYSLATFGILVNRLPMALDFNTTLRKDNITYHTKWLRMQEEKERAIRNIHFDTYREAVGSAEQHNETNNDRDFDLGTWNYGYGEDEESSAHAIRNMSVSTSGAPQVVGMKAVTIFRSRFVECPRHEDCLFGRGRNTMKHPGNVAMRFLLKGKRIRYACAAHQKKSEIAWEVVNQIKTGGGRFLKELDTGFFTIVDDETARKKISIAFRDSKNKVGKRTQRIHQKQQQQQNEREGKPKQTTSRHPTVQDYSSGGSSGANSEIDCFQKCF